MKPTHHIPWMAALACAGALGCGGIDPDSQERSPDLVTGRDRITICPLGVEGALGVQGALGADPALIDPCNPPPPPPPPPPPAPGFLTYTPFTETSVLRVRWGGISSATSYILDLQANGAWSRLFVGLATSVDLPLPGNGVYRLRVAACNANGCSASRVEEEMRLSFGPDRQTGAAGSAPFAAAAATSVPLPGLDALLTDPGTHELLPILGAAYDQLRQELTANRCIDMVGAEIANQPARLKDYLFTQVHTRAELATSLNLTQNLSVSAKFGLFGGSYTLKKSLLSEATRVEETSMLVASLRDQMRVETLINHSLRPLDANFASILSSGDAARFRNLCGDGYVYSIAYGRQVYLSFQLRSFKYTKDEIKTQTSNLKVDIGAWASGGFDSTVKTELHSKYEKYEINVRVVSYGSAAVVSGVVDFASALQYLQNFEAEPPGNEYPFSQLVADYTPPAGSPFADYHPILPPLQRWYSFDQQIATRCEFFDENLYPDDALKFDVNAAPLANGLSLRTACFRMKRAIQENIQNCEDTQKWGQCIHPDVPSCGVPNELDSCLSYANKFPRWDAVPGSLRLVGYGGLFGASKTLRGDSCFAVPTMLDLRIGSVDCAGIGGCPAVRKGVTVTTVKLLRASNGWNSWNPTNRCLHAEVTVSNGGTFGFNAYADITHTASGMQPTFPMYLF